MKKKYISNKKKISKTGHQKKRKFKVPLEAKILARTHNLGVYDALAVFKKKITLEKALEKKIEKNKRKIIAKKICEKNSDVDLALACHLVKENLSVEEYLVRKENIKNKKRTNELNKKVEMEKDTLQMDAFDKLSEYVEKKTTLVIEKYKNKEKKMQILDFTPYQFFAKHPQKDINFEVHRTKIKYMYAKNVQNTVKKFIMLDKELQKKRQKPTHERKGRFQFSKNALKKGNEVMLALHEGEMLRGKVIWSTPYDIMLNLANNNVWVFRHSVSDCMVLKEN